MVLRSLEAVSDRIKLDLEQTEVDLSSLISLLEHSEKRDKDTEHYSFTDYKSLLQECEESVKMAKASAQTTKEYDYQDELSIKVQLCDGQGQAVKTAQLFEDGLRRQSIENSTASPEFKNESTLLCHLVYSMLKLSLVSLKLPTKKTGGAVAQAAPHATASPAAPATATPVVPSANVRPLVSSTRLGATPMVFPVMKKFFIFSFMDKADKLLANLIVFPEPVSSNNDAIVSELGNGCLKEKKLVTDNKVGSFVNIVESNIYPL